MYFMNRSEVWLINLDPAVGSEIRKIRPGVIVNANGLGILPLRVIVPVTDWKDHYEVASWMVKLLPDDTNGLSKPSAADCFQIRSVSTNRLIQKLGEITQDKMDAIELALEKVLKL
jgi:mRNA interferase MazF